jgi:hypothetical protein
MQLRTFTTALMMTGCIALQAHAVPIKLGPLVQDSADAIGIENFEFDSSAFPDAIVSHTLELPDDLEGSSILRALNDDKLTSYIDPDYLDDYVILDFTDNAILNGSGYDLAIFELWAAEAIRISLAPDQPGIFVTPTYSGYKTTFSSGDTARVNIAWVDLSDLGIVEGDLVTRLVIGATGSIQTNINNATSSPEIAAIAAINNVPTPPTSSNSVPEPGTLALLGLGLAGLLMGRQRKA